MGFFTVQTKIVDIDADNKITIRRLDYGQRQACISKSSKANPVTQDVSIDFALLRTEEMLCRVVAWEGPGFENQPVNRDTVLRLPTWIADKLQEDAEGWDASLGDDEKK